MAIHEETAVPGFIGYKMASYSKYAPHIVISTADNTKDWDGLYVAPNKAVAEGYGPDYLNQHGSGTTYLYEVHLLWPMNLLFCDDDSLGDGTISQDVKAARVREQLTAARFKNPAGPLIPGLAAKRRIFKCFHDKEGNHEIIIPNMLAGAVSLIRPEKFTYRQGRRT